MKNLQRVILYKRAVSILVLFLFLFALPVYASVTLMPGTYTENHDGMHNMEGQSSSLMPSGWEFAETGGNQNTSYRVGSGTGTGGDTYSFGTGSETERAFGELTSNSLQSTLGVEFFNSGGDTIDSLNVSYTCEQWRHGGSTETDRLDFQYSTDASSLTTGTWTDVDALDCVSVVTGGSTGALDGNLPANQTAVSGSITGLNIPSTFAGVSGIWFRWNPNNISGADDGLAIDDFQLVKINPTSVTLQNMQVNSSPSSSLILIVSMIALLSVSSYLVLRRHLRA